VSDRADIYRYALEEIATVGAYTAENCEGMADYAQRVLDGTEDEHITRELAEQEELAGLALEDPAGRVPLQERIEQALRGEGITPEEHKRLGEILEGLKRMTPEDIERSYRDVAQAEGALRGEDDPLQGRMVEREY
jgi:hypothetical protein